MYQLEDQNVSKILTGMNPNFTLKIETKNILIL